jgi:hypothetical protein
MTNCEKAIEILQRTHDGDDLAPQHLKLVELAVNDMVTEVGQAAFEQLYTQINGSTYMQPWYHDIENLRKDHCGYVYWKGIQVDHYSFDRCEDAHEAALELADRCRTLEMLGIPVSTAHQAWWYDELASAVTSNSSANSKFNNSF